MAANIQVGLDGAEFEKGLEGLRQKAQNFNRDFDKAGEASIFKGERVVKKKIGALIGGLSSATGEGGQLGVAISNIGGMLQTSIAGAAAFALGGALLQTFEEMEKKTREVKAEMKTLDATVRKSAFADPHAITAGIDAVQEKMSEVQAGIDARGKHFDWGSGMRGLVSLLQGKSPMAPGDEEDAAQQKRAQARVQMAENLIGMEAKLNEIVKLRLADENEAAASRQLALEREQKVAAIEEMKLGAQQKARLIAAAEREAADKFALQNKGRDESAAREREHTAETIALSKLKLSGMDLEAQALERQQKLREKLQDIARSNLSTGQKKEASDDARALFGREQLIADITEAAKPAAMRNAEAARERATRRANENAIRRAVTRDQNKFGFSDAEKERRIAKLQADLLAPKDGVKMAGLPGAKDRDPRLDHLQDIATTIQKLEAKLSVK